MPAPLTIPKVFTTGNPAALKKELERLAQELDRFLSERDAGIERAPLVGDINAAAVAFDQVVPVSPREGETVIVKLPQPNVKNIGKKCSIFRMTEVGEVLIYAVGCLVAGHERYRMANDVHSVEFRYFGSYYPTRAGGGF